MTETSLFQWKIREQKGKRSAQEMLTTMKGKWSKVIHIRNHFKMNYVKLRNTQG